MKKPKILKKKFFNRRKPELKSLPIITSLSKKDKFLIRASLLFSCLTFFEIGILLYLHVKLGLRVDALESSVSGLENSIATVFRAVGYYGLLIAIRSWLKSITGGGSRPPSS
jgi:hypothetical protein